ncbi:hypothetical protein EJ04DRAFT_289055 [Polyplosphaeria fusca]|uniref:Uncharacterized protein n=1 Tax=Polyplosphaeria fusca TaxID=682080 RepID=A0A9P4R9L3_9PLEO|nr:hypothetical protein EJ04DRAFT_289055 [Polyplosphaeria fusca]
MPNDRSVTCTDRLAWDFDGYTAISRAVNSELDEVMEIVQDCGLLCDMSFALSHIVDEGIEIARSCNLLFDVSSAVKLVVDEAMGIIRSRSLLYDVSSAVNHIVDEANEIARNCLLEDVGSASCSHHLDEAREIARDVSFAHHQLTDSCLAREEIGRHHAYARQSCSAGEPAMQVVVGQVHNVSEESGCLNWVFRLGVWIWCLDLVFGFGIWIRCFQYARQSCTAAKPPLDEQVVVRQAHKVRLKRERVI